MDPIPFARAQFAITTVYHFFFVPLTLGLSVMVALMETIYVRTGRLIYKEMAKFWGKLLVINFAMGVVTGIVQEFQFGMNWSEYSRFVGDIFGAPLAIEALLAFFLESTFLGIWIFGWDRLSKGLHALAMWMVAIGSNVSALWILVANSFMQQPVGYTIRNGRAEMTDFFALVLNPNVQVQFPHTVLAGFTTAAFFVMGVSAYHLLRKQHVEFFRRSFQMGAIIGAFAIVLVGLSGHSQAQEMVRSQPMKMAAAEALWYTENPASFSILTIGDLAQRRDVFSIRIPRLLSLLAYNQLSGEVKGIHDLQAEYVQKYGEGNYIPPVAVTYWTFRIMVGSGILLGLLGLYAVFVVMGDVYDTRRFVWRLFPYAIALPYIANTSGWLMTELGRVPWVVYGVMKIDEAISPTVSGGMVLFTFLAFTLLYAALMGATIYLLRKYALAGPPIAQDGEQGAESSLAVVPQPAQD
ncbi:MAG: cytochrome ubiquinol oxidase subunit I [Anaerolineales bacterium]|nr:cytochrome ubiquinol oxidase subunit I [Anaerolineales bacterium]MCS7246929.1 cytochrome ubiquinol oxidase subunit I [Anaerolineales bacterium]MDW8160740.1 cytochrome ubiquinol oxidase subunit I [Anaerolineales bacterium]MDW8447491.1 cytochrome ubiquinol oxidase subunit I [Anaerolineales bacterium]